MSDKIIIDGVDVAECYFYYKGECRCELNCIDYDKGETIDELFDRQEHNYMECQPSSNCYYKQLQRQIAENDGLKSQLDFEIMNKETLVYNCEKFIEGNIKLKQALEEVREIAKSCMNKDVCLECNYYDDCEIEDSEMPTHDICKLIINKINEVLK